jgi:hypothetical protein
MGGFRFLPSGDHLVEMESSGSRARITAAAMAIGIVFVVFWMAQGPT